MDRVPADRRSARPFGEGIGRVPSRQRAELREPFERLYRTFDHQHSVSDPVHIVRRYAAPDDREVVGFFAAGLAFGRVASVLNSIESLLAVMGPRPAAFVRGFNPAENRGRLEPLVHRWIRGSDLIALVLILQRMLRESGSIERFFLAGDAAGAPDIGPVLEVFSTRALAMDVRTAYGRMPNRPGVYYFFPRPSAGSACKRLNLFLRWMVRKDVVDLGVWTGLSPSRLIVPLDTHVIRLGQCLRLTRYRSPRVEDGGRDHRVAARHRSLGSGALRFLALPRGDDERLRIQPGPEGLAVPATWRVSSKGQKAKGESA